MASRRRSRLALIALLLALLLLALEGGVRCAGLVQDDRGIATPHHGAFNAANMFVHDADAGVSYRNRPDAATRVDDVDYVHDARGRRVTPAPGAADDAPVVAFLGDSTTYGFGLRPEDTLPARVAAELGGAIRPLNLAVCGYATSQQAALYAAERDALGDAPVVVLVLFPNDFIPGVFLWDEPLRLLYVDATPLPRALKRLLWRSALYRLGVSWSSARAKAAGAYSPHDPAHVDGTLHAVARLAADVQADGRTLLVAHLPALEALDPYEFEAQTAKLAARCAELGVPYVDLLDAFLAERAREVAAWEQRTGQPAPEGPTRHFLSRYWLVDPADHHPNAEAIRLAARALAPRVRALLPTPDAR